MMWWVSVRRVGDPHPARSHTRTITDGGCHPGGDREVTVGLEGTAPVDLCQPSGRFGLQPVDPTPPFRIPGRDLTIRQPDRIISHRLGTGEGSHHHRLSTTNHKKYPPPV